jgi:RimJ/RimL family protein N-acetyltransferase
MLPFDAIRTPRLTLRRPRPADAPLVFAGYAQDPEVTRYLAWRPHGDIEETRRHIAACIDTWDGTLTRAYMIDGEGEPAIGAFDLRLRSGPGGVSFGYVLARRCWGRGYMTEVLKAVVERALAQHDVWRVWAFCDIDNLASARVMEKAGLAFEGILRRWAMAPCLDPIAPRDCRCYARVK